MKPLFRIIYSLVYTYSHMQQVLRGCRVLRPTQGPWAQSIGLAIPGGLKVSRDHCNNPAKKTYYRHILFCRDAWPQDHELAPMKTR